MDDQLINILQQINSNLHQSCWEIILGIINIVVLMATLIFLIKYTIETEKTRKQITKQTEIAQMPIMLMFIRKIADNPRQEQTLRNKFLIHINAEQKSNFFITLRNTGNGTAFNVKMESDKFEIVDYKTRFYAPHKDEHPIKISPKNNLGDLNNSKVTISCDDYLGKERKFEYQIIDVKDRRIKYVN